MRLVKILSNTLAIIVLSSPWTFAGGDPQLLDLFMDTSPGTPEPAKAEPIVTRAAKTATASAKRHLQVAQKSILKLSDENMIPKSSLANNPKVATVDDPRAKAETARIESNIDRKMQSLQRTVEREEKKLEATLAKLNRRRQSALEKSDEKQLKQIEAAEKKAVADYERRVERVLSSAVISTKPQRAGQRGTASSGPTAVQRKLNAANRKKAEPSQQRRRFRLWPFN